MAQRINNRKPIDKISPQAEANSVRTAKTLVEESAIVRALFTVDIISRQLYLLSQTAIRQELQHGWDVQAPHLVLNQLARAAATKAAEPISHRDLRAAIQEQILPVLDIFCQMEFERMEGQQTDEQPISGADAQPEA